MTIDPKRLIIALDLSDPDAARNLAKELSPLGVAYKIGLELFMTGGPKFVAAMAAEYSVFLDLKFHDIPNTVAAAVRNAADLGVWMLNVHAAGGREMLLAAREAVDGPRKPPLLVAVTVLTSMVEKDLTETGCPGSAEDRVLLLSRLTAESGFDGVVCSPLEVATIKANLPASFITVTPGVRPLGGEKADQRRIATPAAVVEAGGDYLVVGRPITQAADPYGAASQIIREMRSA